MKETLLPPEVETTDDQAWIERTIQDGWPPVATEPELNQKAIVVNSIITGPRFPRFDTPHTPARIKESQITAAIDHQTSDTHLSPTKPSTRLKPTDHPQLPRRLANQIYPVESQTSRTLKTVARSKTSRSAFSINDQFRSRGGDPNYKIEKTGGFFSDRNKLLPSRTT